MATMATMKMKWPGSHWPSSSFKQQWPLNFKRLFRYLAFSTISKNNGIVFWPSIPWIFCDLLGLPQAEGPFSTKVCSQDALGIPRASSWSDSQSDGGFLLDNCAIKMNAAFRHVGDAFPELPKLGDYLEARVLLMGRRWYVSSMCEDIHERPQRFPMLWTGSIQVVEAWFSDFFLWSRQTIHFTKVRCHCSPALKELLSTVPIR